MNYNRVYCTHHRNVVKRWFDAPVIYPQQIYEYNQSSAFVYDIYDVEGNGLWDVDRVSAHVQSDPRSRIYINLASENCTPTYQAMRAYDLAIKEFSCDRDRITVLCSQSDILHRCAELWHVATEMRNFWETHTRCVIDEYPVQAEPTHRLVTLNRRYTPERAQAVHALWPHRQNVYYTFGCTPGWSDIPIEEYAPQEWQGYDENLRDEIFAWQDTAQPWRSLDDRVDHTEWDTQHLLQAQCRGQVALVVESRVRTKLPHRPAFITEKTYRCFALGIPAIIIGHPRTRHTLESQGYVLPAYEDPIEYAVQLASCSDKLFRKQLKQLQRIAEHNKQNFYSRTA